jgi:hypothetical protein
MPHFRVKLNGENFWLDFEGKPSRMGFYTTRFVVADTPNDAELAAVHILRADPKLQYVLNDKTDPPMIYAGEIVEIEPEAVPEVQPGFAFYPEGADA